MITCIPYKSSRLGFDQNSYLCFDEGREAVVIDPDSWDEKQFQLLDAYGIRVKYILLTHGHFDHIGGLQQTRTRLGAKVLIHEADALMLTDSKRNLSAFMDQAQKYGSADQFVQDGECLSVGDMMIKVLHTPGHTEGGCCFLIEDLLFSGDTLFDRGVGRTDFPGGNTEQLICSIREKLLTLPDATKIYPGHGTATTIAKERLGNPFLGSGYCE